VAAADREEQVAEPRKPRIIAKDIDTRILRYLDDYAAEAVAAPSLRRLRDALKEEDAGFERVWDSSFDASAFSEQRAARAKLREVICIIEALADASEGKTHRPVRPLPPIRRP
jgi:hypothetical protein